MKGQQGELLKGHGRRIEESSRLHVEDAQRTRANIDNVGKTIV